MPNYSPRIWGRGRGVSSQPLGDSAAAAGTRWGRASGGARCARGTASSDASHRLRDGLMTDGSLASASSTERVVVVAHSWPNASRTTSREGKPRQFRQDRSDHTGTTRARHSAASTTATAAWLSQDGLAASPCRLRAGKRQGVGCSPSGIDRLVKSFSAAATAHVAPMGSQSERESPLRQRIRLLRELERSLAEKPDAEAHILALAAVRELLTEAEAKLEH
jgi:hypothetical protein